MQRLLLQTNNPPLLALCDVKNFINTQATQADWDNAAILADVGNTIVLLRSSQRNIVQALRICVETKKDTIEALKLLNKSRSNRLQCSVVEQGIGDICDIVSLGSIASTVEYTFRTVDNAYQFYDPKEPNGNKNRGPNISKDVAQQVVCDAHGYCMYEGCGEHLLRDHLTGVNGNFHYLAHIVASSPNGPRGNEHSHLLSDVATNIMLLCDKHHRLIDKVAVGEHSRERLDEMRRAHMDKVARLLNGLAYQGVPTFTATWTVGSWVPDPPTPQELAVSLQPLHSYHNGMAFPPLLNRAYPQQMTDQDWFDTVPRELDMAKVTYAGSRVQPDVRTGLYAIAPGVILIGLGSIVGNKNGLHAIPRSREHNSWCWARKDALTDPFTIEGLDQLVGDQQEVTIALTLTDEPQELLEVAGYQATNGSPIIQIKAKLPGNNCLAHPDEGHQLRELVHKTLHYLRNRHGTELVHLLPCAPNAALVEVGRAIEHFHPSVRVYEHLYLDGQKYMVPRIDLITGDDQVRVRGTPLEVVEQFHKQFQTVTTEE